MQLMFSMIMDITWLYIYLDLKEQYPKHQVSPLELDCVHDSVRVISLYTSFYSYNQNYIFNIIWIYKFIALLNFDVSIKYDCFQQYITQQECNGQGDKQILTTKTKEFEKRFCSFLYKYQRSFSTSIVWIMSSMRVEVQEIWANYF